MKRALKLGTTVELVCAQNVKIQWILSVNWVQKRLHEKSCSGALFPQRSWSNSSDFFNSICFLFLVKTTSSGSFNKTLAVTQLFQNAGIYVLDWPAYSPDMNCIENVWSELKRLVRKKSCLTRVELIDLVKEIWTEDTKFNDLCRKVFELMSPRIQALKHVKGCFTRHWLTLNIYMYVFIWYLLSNCI